MTKRVSIMEPYFVCLKCFPRKNGTNTGLAMHTIYFLLISLCVLSTGCISSSISTAQSTMSTYTSSIQPIPQEIAQRMIGVTWHEGCPIALTDLSLLHMSYWTMDNTTAQGQMIIATAQAQTVVQIFETLYNNHFPLTSMKLMWEFGGDDDASMRANNTSGFNCRKVKNTSSWSKHSYGHAIDINPLWNPWVRGDVVDPPEGKEFVDRTMNHPGVIKDGDLVVQAFLSRGWFWGGHWSKYKDYQHFSATGT